MKALILAAGRGERMGALTENTPKPLIKLNGLALIEHRIVALREAGIKEIVINLFYLGKKIQDYLGNGSRHNVTIEYSIEETPLDVGGGIHQASRLLGQNPFIITSADIDTDYAYQNLPTLNNELAHLVLTNNPSHHPQGDFHLNNRVISLSGQQSRLSYMSIGVINPKLFELTKPGRLSFMELLKPAIDKQLVSGEYFNGRWINVDTPERLSLAEQSS